MSFSEILSAIDGYVWGIPLIVLVLLTGALLTFRLRLVQVTRLGKALRYMVRNEEGGKGEVSSFSALCTALSATVGTGNIVGVATAVCVGGPGALFWMLVAAFLGMATKYTEGFLAVKYRQKDSSGRYLGGPFTYIEKGLGERFGHSFRWLAVFFAVSGVVAGMFGIGNMTQVNSITSALNALIPSRECLTFAGKSISLVTVVSGLIVTVLVALVLIGGLKRIASVSSVIVPFMIVTYIVFCLLILILNIGKLVPAIGMIVHDAFTGGAIQGGAMGTMFVAMQKGIARGIFSNEAGLGSAPIAAAAAKTNDPVRQGLVSMTGTFIDTIIICMMTGLTIVITGSWLDPDVEGAGVTMLAFAKGLPFNEIFSKAVLTFCLAIFAFTTILGWHYYSERCFQYLFKPTNKVAGILFRWLYIAAVFIAPYMTISEVWTIADIFNALMALPNLIALVLLSGVAARDTKAWVPVE